MSIFKRGLHIAGKQLIIIAAIFAAIGLTLLACAFWLTQAVTERKDEMAAWASEQSGYQIEIGEASLYWFDLLPKLMLADVSVRATDSGDPVLHLGEIYAGIDPLKSLILTQPVLGSAQLEDLRIGLQRHPDGQFKIPGLDKQADNDLQQNQRLLSTFAGLQQVTLNGIAIDYKDAIQPQLSGHYQILHAALAQSGKVLQGNADIQLPHHLGNQLHLQGSLTHQQAAIEDWQLAVTGRDLQLLPLLEQQQFIPVSVDRGRADADLDFRKSAQGLTADGSLNIRDAQLITLLEDEQTPIVVDQFAGNISANYQKDLWQLDLTNMAVIINGQSWPDSALTVSRQTNGDVTLKSPYLNLKHVSDIAALTDKTPPLLQQLRPTGEVTDLTLLLNANKQTIDSLQAVFTDLTLGVSEQYPGVSGLTGKIDWQGQQLQANIDSRNATIEAPQWLPAPLHFAFISGQVNWDGREENARFAVKDIFLLNPDLQLQLNGHWQDGQPPQTDFQAQIVDLQVNRWLSYVPEKVLEPRFLDWAENAFLQGQINHGTIKLQGDPAAFPFDENADAGSFSLQLDVSDVVLDYGKGWPNLRNVAGSVTGDGNTLQIQTRAGSIAGFTFSTVDANIVNLIDGLPQLTVDGQLRGETRQGLLFLQNSPLASRFGPIADWLTPKGNSNLQLSLTVPLLDPKATAVRGDIALEDNSVVIAGVEQLPFQQLAGDIAFDNDGLYTDNLTANLAGQPAAITIKPNDEAIRVSLQTHIDTGDMAKIWQLDLPAAIQGSSDVSADIDIAEPNPGEFQVQASLNSDLQGITVDLPAPFSKTAEQRLPLTINTSGQDQLQINAELGDWLRGVILPGDKPFRAAVNFGSGRPALPEKGIVVSGQLQALELDVWQQWFNDNLPETGNNSLPLTQFDLQFDKISWQQLELTSLQIDAQRQSAAWQIALNADQLKGDIIWPLNDSGLPTLHFDFIDMPLPAGPEQQVSRPDNLWPGFQLNVDKLVLDDMQLGRLQARAIGEPMRWQLESVALSSENFSMTGNGNWRRTDDGDHTTLQFQASSPDLAGLLTDWGYQPAISAESSSISGNFSWPAAPTEFNRKQLNGQMQLDVADGSLREVKTGAAGRIFGLLSFTAIPRRLSLDFSDLFEDGFRFSRISGKMDFADGMATTQDLTMRGDSALIQVTGPIDLVNKRYDQQVQITPSVASTLPIAGAVAGGPLGLGVGTAIFLADRIAGKLFDRELVDIISYRYQLTGPWDDPQMSLSPAPENP